MIFKIIFITLFGIEIFIRTIIDRLNILFLQNNQNIPEELEGIIDKEKSVRICNYNLDKTKYNLIKELIETGILIIFLFTPLFSIYFRWIDSLNITYLLRGLLFFWIFFFVDYLITLPIDYLYTFRVEQKFGFNRYSLNGWIIDQLKQITLTIIILGIIIAPILLFVNNNFHFSWGFVIIGSSLLSFLAFIFMYLTPVVFIPIFYKLKPVDNTSLKEKITEIVEKAGFKLKGIYMADESKKSSHANAMFAGFGNSRSVIIFDNLLNNYSEEEILAILGHEIGHGVYKHILKFLIFTVVEIFVFFLIAAIFLSMQLFYTAMGIEKSLYAGLFVIMILFFYLIGYFIKPISLAFSRRYEYQADAYSKKLLGTAKGQVSAFKKFITNELSVIEPHPIYEWFYYSHPSLIRRIRRLKEDDI